MDNNWKTSVSELIEIFRGSLLAIIPWVEKAKIKWREDQYDDWDNITQALFRNIVCSSIQGDISSRYSIANYDFIYEDYSNWDYIRVKSENYSNKVLVFISFQSELMSLEKVRVAILDSKEKVTGYLSLNINEVQFSLEKKIDNKRKNIKTIKIAL